MKLYNTFQHIKGISKFDERIILNSDSNNWDKFLENPVTKISENKISNILEELPESKKNYKKRNHKYFYDRLKASLHWRLFPDFIDKLVYIDIETTGFSPIDNDVTLISIYKNKSIKTFIKDDNLLEFKKELEEDDILVSYNGKNFDIPFINKNLNFKLNHTQIDLRWMMHNLGISGGLKSSEQYFSIDRKSSTEIDGLMAVKLWNYYKSFHDINALNILIYYNQEDTVNLEQLLHVAYNYAIKYMYVNKKKVVRPKRPTLKKIVDEKTIEVMINNLI